MTKTTESATTTKATAATPGAQDAPKRASTKGQATKAKGAPKAKKTASKPAAKEKDAKPAARKAPKAGAATAPREGSKKETVLLLLARKDGATMAEIADATGWQRHSIRGFISGTLTKKMGLAVESTKNEAGERTYRTK